MFETFRDRLKFHRIPLMKTGAINANTMLSTSPSDGERYFSSLFTSKRLALHYTGNASDVSISDKYGYRPDWIELGGKIAVDYDGGRRNDAEERKESMRGKGFELYIIDKNFDDVRNSTKLQEKIVSDISFMMNHKQIGLDKYF